MKTASLRRPVGKTVDVIIPVFNQLDLVRRCIESVINSDCETPINLIIIDDSSSDESVPTQIKKMAIKHKFSFLQNSKNLGFPDTCNRGFLLNPENDVLILNSDTEVYGDWLDRIVEIAYSDSSIGTVTPLTNDGEISSYPNWLKPNTFDLEISGRELDRFAAEVNKGEWHEAPTGVGFCMYFKRECLESVGIFDSEAFGRGYGEENDFCQRAIKTGWLNAITPSVFVKHHGGSSFGSSKVARIASAVRVLAQKHPGYSESVEKFIRADPLRLARERLDIARVRRRTTPNSILMMTHNWGGGTERHVRELRDSLEASGVSTLICRPDKNDPDLMHVLDDFTEETPNLRPLRISKHPKLFIDRIKSLGVSHVHIHNLAGYSELARDYIQNALSGSGITYDVTIHDYQYWCPRINLVGVTGVYCGEPSPSSCQSCVNTLGSPLGHVSVWNWRRSYELLLREARAVFAPSNDTARRVESHLPGLSVKVREHQLLSKKISVDIGEKPSLPNAGLSPKERNKRIGIIGSISKEKGGEILLETSAYFRALSLPVTFVVIGTVYNTEKFAAHKNIELRGEYKDEQLDQIISSMKLDAIWFPAIWPETYSFTLTSALKSGLPIAAFDLGAIGERLKALGQGKIIPIYFARNQEKVTQALLETLTGHKELGYLVKNPYDTDPLGEYYGLIPNTGLG